MWGRSRGVHRREGRKTEEDAGRFPWGRAGSSRAPRGGADPWGSNKQISTREAFIPRGRKGGSSTGEALGPVPSRGGAFQAGAGPSE